MSYRYSWPYWKTAVIYNQEKTYIQDLEIISGIGGESVYGGVLSGGGGGLYSAHSLATHSPTFIRFGYRRSRTTFGLKLV